MGDDGLRADDGTCESGRGDGDRGTTAVDADLDDVRRVRSGDVEAFAGIVHRWQGPIVNLAYRLCRDRALADDLAQMTFLRAYRKLGQWRGNSAFSTWLFAVAYSVCRAELRRRRPPGIVAAPAGTNEEIGAGARAEASDESERVRRAVAALPRKYRDAMTLFYFHEMDVAQTARTLGVAEGTVKARLHRAREMIRQWMSST